MKKKPVKKKATVKIGKAENTGKKIGLKVGRLKNA